MEGNASVARREAPRFQQRQRTCQCRSAEMTARAELLDRTARLIANRRREMHHGAHAAQRVAKRGRIGEVAEGDLNEFLEKPEVRKVRPPRPPTPPGRPIGAE